MAAPIFIVHFFDFGQEYLPVCLRLTARNNPDHPIHLITSSDEIVALAADLKLDNLTCHRLHQEDHDSLFAEVKPIFYHDGKNPEMFDLMCFVRYRVVRHVMNTALANQVINTFYFCDSDIAVTTDIDRLFGHQPTVGEVVSLGAKKSFFSLWDRSAFEAFIALSNMERYFHYAQENRLRCSDMEYLYWCIKIEKNILWHTSESNDYVHLDPLRAFFYENFCFALLDDGHFASDENIPLMQEFPTGIWHSVDFMKRFGDPKFLQKIFLPVQDATGRTGIHLNIKLLSGLITEHAARYMRPDRELRPIPPGNYSSNPTVGMLHLQGNGKKLAGELWDYWRTLTLDPNAWGRDHGRPDSSADQPENHTL